MAPTTVETVDETGDADNNNNNNNNNDGDGDGEEWGDLLSLTTNVSEQEAALERKRKRLRRLEKHAAEEVPVDALANRRDTNGTNRNNNNNGNNNGNGNGNGNNNNNDNDNSNQKTEGYTADGGTTAAFMAQLTKTEKGGIDHGNNNNNNNTNNNNNEENSSNGNDSDEDSDMFGGTSSDEDDKAKPSKKPKSQRASSSKDYDLASSSSNHNHNHNRQDGFDDAEGYYKASIGETMNVEVLGLGGGVVGDTGEDAASASTKLQFRVLGVIGKGVFSSVLKCSTTTTTTTSSSSSSSSSLLPPEVAIKCIRSNETMAKAALSEMKFLMRLKDSPGIVPLLLPSTNSNNNNTNNTNNNNNNTSSYSYSYSYSNVVPIDFRGHTLLVFPYLPYNLRDVLQKFGKGVGLALGAVRNYFGQLLSALGHLERHRILHADLKPDNILVAGDFSTVLLADFGSALATQEVASVGSNSNNNNNTNNTNTTNNNTTTSGSSDQPRAVAGTHEVLAPYLVSRFYRAPEIMMGLQPLTHAIDLWSLAATVGELFLGTVLLTGANNNEMLGSMMELLGPFSGRMIKSHLLQTKKHPLPAHFSQVQSNYVFRKETVDPVLGQAVHKEVSLVNTFKPTLRSRLLKAKSSKDSRTEVLRFADLLTRCMVLDPSRRIGVMQALQHDFFRSSASSSASSSSQAT